MTITSSTDICNLALDLLSAGTVQDVENPSNATESLLARWYELSRKKLLREHPWNFASKRAAIAASGTAPAFGYGKQFPVPNDFVRLLYVVGDDNQIIPPENYQVENNAILLETDASSLRLVYIYDIEDVTRFDPMFVNVLAHEIALGIAYKVTESNGNVERVGALRKQMGDLAKAIDGQERPPIRRQVSKSRAARRFGRTTATDRIVF
jgi:hypothetical protein